VTLYLGDTSAEAAGVIFWHDAEDDSRISAITGQTDEWITPRGSLGRGDLRSDGREAARIAPDRPGRPARLSGATLRLSPPVWRDRAAR